MAGAALVDDSVRDYAFGGRGSPRLCAILTRGSLYLYNFLGYNTPYVISRTKALAASVCRTHGYP